MSGAVAGGAAALCNGGSLQPAGDLQEYETPSTSIFISKHICQQVRYGTGIFVNKFGTVMVYLSARIFVNKNSTVPVPVYLSQCCGSNLNLTA